MANTGLSQLPTDLASMIVDHLPLSDIKNFRQTSRWAEQASFKGFAGLGYKSIRITASKESTARLISVLKKSSCLAKSVRTLEVLFGDATYVEQAPHIWKTKQPDRLLEDLGDTTVAHLLTLLPMLTDLKLYNLDSANFAQHLGAHLLGTTRDNSQSAMSSSIAICNTRPTTALVPAITSLHLQSVNITSGDLEHLLQTWSGTLRQLQLQEIRGPDLDWFSILPRLTSRLHMLEKLILRELLSDSPALLPLDRFGREQETRWAVRFINPSQRLNKGIRGTTGIESITIQERTAHMNGRTAIEIGLGKILGYMRSG